MATPIVGLINAKAYATVQAAVDAAESTGGNVFLPSGTYSPTSTPSLGAGGATLVVPPNVGLIGSGMGATILSVAGSAAHETVPLMQVKGFNTVKGMSIVGPGVAGTGGYLIHASSDVSGTANVSNIVLEDLYMYGNADWAMYLNDTVIVSRIKNVTAYGAIGGGSLYIGSGSTTIWIEDCRLNGPGFGHYAVAAENYKIGGVWIRGSTASITFNNCVFENNSDTPFISIGDTGKVNWQTRFTNTYLERDSGSTGVEYAVNTVGSATFSFNGVYSGNYPTITAYGPRFLKTGTAAAILQCRLTNMSLSCNVPNASMPTTDDIAMNGLDGLTLDNCQTSTTDVGMHGTSLTSTNAHRAARIDGWGHVGANAGAGRSYMGPMGLQLPGIARDANMTALATSCLSGALIWDLTLTTLVYKDNTSGRFVPLTRLPTVTRATRDSATGPGLAVAGNCIWVTDATAGENFQVYNGTNWKTWALTTVTT